MNGKENVMYIHNGVLVRHKEKQYYVICWKMDEKKNNYHIKWNKAGPER